MATDTVFDWSLGEIHTLSIKASRGAGISWGLAQEAGFAVEWLQRRGYAGVRALRHYLQCCDQLDDKNLASQTSPVKISNHTIRSKQALNPLLLGAWISDSQTIPHNKHLNIYQPLLLVPFIARKTLIQEKTPKGVQQHYLLRWENTQITIQDDDLKTQNLPEDLLISNAFCTITSAVNSVTRQPLSHTQHRSSRQKTNRYHRVPDTLSDDIAILEQFAYRTYAPESEFSRLTGAGTQNNNDND